VCSGSGAVRGLKYPKNKGHEAGSGSTMGPVSGYRIRDDRMSQEAALATWYPGHLNDSTIEAMRSTRSSA